MRLEISTEADEAHFRCDFCGKDYEWPFGGRILWPGQSTRRVFPEPRHVIMTHYFEDAKMRQFEFPQCPAWNRWSDTTWDCVDKDGDVVLASGLVTIRDGYPDVVVFDAPVQGEVGLNDV